MFPITVIGSFPKPKNLKIPSWFDCNQNTYDLEKYNDYISNTVKSLKNESNLKNAFQSVINEQINCGVDVVTDGEIDRENYIWHFCRQLNGFDFKHTMKKKLRGGAAGCISVPVIRSKICRTRATDEYFGETLSDNNNSKRALYSPLSTHYLAIKEMCSKNADLKITIPGPMTILDSCENVFYKNTDELLMDLSIAINDEILSLCKLGCKFIQIDEPLWARKPLEAKRIGFKCMEKCWTNVGNIIYKCVHICCGYSNELDEINYRKAECNSYVKLAEYGMDDVQGIDAISVEDAYKRIPMVFFKIMKKTDIILGCVTSVTSDVLSVESIVQRVEQIVEESGFYPTRIVLAPDCGLAMLPLNIIRQKMSNLQKARDLLCIKYTPSMAKL